MAERLFFALQPDAGAVTQIKQVSKNLRAKYPISKSDIPAERLHVTLYFVGDFVDAVPHAVLDSACAAANGIIAHDFELSFDQVLSFRSTKAERPLVLTGSSQMSKLQLLRHELAKRLRSNGLTADKAAFTPHITLAYDPCAIPVQKLESPVAWTAHEFVLIKSQIGKSRYEVLARWPLLPN